MKGQFIDVEYRTPIGNSSKRVQAMKDGASVHVKMPDRGDLFVRVEEVNKVDAVVRTFRFLASEVIVITEGHEQIARKGKK
jgi:hypothetical protein